MSMIKSNVRGFTLIELLVVITIIGILATGATSVYTSQIQKARDATRMSAVEALNGGAEQAYQDSGEYPYPVSDTGPKSFRTEMIKYTPKLPQDPKDGQKSAAADFQYTYTAGPDSNSIAYQEFEFSTAFEQSGNLTKALNDNWNSPNRLEVGIDTANNNSGSGAATGTVPVAWAACTGNTTTVGTLVSPAASACIVIR